MGKINFLSMKGSIIGIFITLILILSIPLLFLLSQESNTLTNNKQEPTPTPVTMTFANGEGNIAGYVYHDDNTNGKREAEEKPFADVTVQMKVLSEQNEKEDKIFESTTDTYGYFSFRFPRNTAASYMVKVVLPKGHKTVDANPLIISDLKQNTQKIVEFGLTPSGEIPLSPASQRGEPTRKPTVKPTENPSP